VSLAFPAKIGFDSLSSYDATSQSASSEVFRQTHESMVDDQSTLRLFDFKLSCVRHLESTPHHSLVQTTQTFRHVPRVSTPHKSVIISITHLCRRRRSHHRLLFRPTSKSSCQTIKSDPAELVRLHDTLEALKSSSTNSNSSHDNFMLVDMTSGKTFKNPCCVNKSFNLSVITQSFSSTELSTSNLVPDGARVLRMANPAKN
jgi:hypothetical protein